MASQWPNNYQAQAYGYNQYEQPAQQYGQQYSQQQYQQYPQQKPQQYPQSQPQPQQYVQQNYQQPFPQYPQQPAQQAGQYQTQYAPATNAAWNYQAQPQPGHQGCYNCGATGHWAQDCPEPRRETPAGAYNHPPPFKKQKPNPPVVTRYAVPPHVQQNQGPPPQNHGLPYPAYPQSQVSYAPPTPLSGQSPSQQQWQQQPYGQHYQQPYPQQPLPQQQQYTQSYQQTGYQPQQQPYVPTAPPTPATPYGAHQTTQGSPQTAHYNAASYSQYGQYYQQRPVSQVQQMSNASPVSSISQTVSYQHPQQYPAVTTTEPAPTQHGSRTSSVSMRSMSVTPKPQPVEPAEDADDDDISKLDVPDIPSITHDVTFANLVDRPLPTNFVVADALDPFDPPQPENDCHCRSKYTVQDASSTFVSSVRDTRHWEDLKNDPIFIPVHVNDKIISLDVIMSVYRPRDESEERDQADLEEGEWTKDTRSSARHEEEEDVMGRLERSLSAEKSPQVPANAPQTVSSEQARRDNPSHYSRREHPGEETNALRDRPSQIDPLTHGKRDRPAEETSNLQWPTKIPRLGRTASIPLPPPPARAESPIPSPDRNSPLRSRTPSMYELNELYQQETGQRFLSNNATGSSLLDTAPDGHGKQEQQTGPYPLDPFELPPPPAHLRKPTSFDGASELPLAAGSPNGQLNGDGYAGSHHDNTDGRSYLQDHSASPTRLRSDAVNGHKREYDQQLLSDEDNTPKRRQVDDTKSKLKKRQPKVAAAYSRRW
ncbi:MAG: hypothetical protein Q9181_002042 [Wetmoreana brouardii]